MGKVTKITRLPLTNNCMNLKIRILSYTSAIWKTHHLYIYLLKKHKYTWNILYPSQYWLTSHFSHYISLIIISLINHYIQSRINNKYAYITFYRLINENRLKNAQWFFPGSIRGQGKIINVSVFYHQVNMVL